jgi:3-carboxy-cis,cis-muconate cycloisomerase
MAVSPFDHPLLSGLFGDDTAMRYFSADAEIGAMLDFERALAEAEATEGIIEAEAVSAIAAALDKFVPDMAALKAGTGRDGVVVPELVRQLRVAIGKPHDADLHFGATSQDVIDTALILRLKPAIEHIDTMLAEFAEALSAIERRFGIRRLMGRTRMQSAIEISVADRVLSWRAPLARHRIRLSEQRKDLLVVQFGGAAGTLDKLGDKAGAVRSALAERLGLGDAPQWHSQRDRLADFANVLSLITGSLGKFGQDMALMVQIGGEIELTGGGGSSAMPHKQNPVAAEVLDTLARFNATQLSGMHQALVHEQERSGAAWALEWLLLPQMVGATAGALRLANLLVGQIENVGSK